MSSLQDFNKTRSAFNDRSLDELRDVYGSKDENGSRTLGSTWCGHALPTRRLIILIIISYHIIVMGNYKTKHKDADATKEERLYPEPRYEIKTRPPITEGHTWKQNIQLHVR
jgi:hypothetical protein